MALQYFPVSDEAGFDFGSLFHDPTLMTDVLQKLKNRLPDLICGYCLNFEEIRGGRSWFRPYVNGSHLPGLVTDGRTALPERIWYERLVLPPRNDSEINHWPVVGWRRLNGTAPPEMPVPLRGADYHAQIRLEGRNSDGAHRFLAYIKLAMRKGAHETEEAVILPAFDDVRGWLRGIVPTRVVTDGAFHRELSTLRPELERRMRIPVLGPRLALRLLCTYATSHLRNFFQRIAFFAPDENGDLRCAYAHGGDCSPEFSRRVQQPLGERIRNVDDLIREVDSASIGPLDDPLFMELVGGSAGPLKISRHSSSALEQAWRSGANLHGERVLRAPSYLELSRHEGTIRYPASDALGLELTADDDLFTRLKASNPHSSWVRNRTSRYFLVPWRAAAPLGLFIVDCGYCDSVHPARDLTPRLLMTRGVLDFAAPVFAAAGPWFRGA